MQEVRDNGNWKNRLNSKLSDYIAAIFGAKVNYALRYYSQRRRFPNFKHPKDLSERILSAMLSPDFLKYADYADKVKVRDYVISKGLDSILLKLYGTWSNAKQIQWDSLPEKYILKTNNGCGGHVICTDKDRVDVLTATKLLNATLNVRQLKKVEPHYGAIKPLILCEELLGDGIILPVDYKFHCIKGKVEFILVISERENGTKKIVLNQNWEVLPYLRTEEPQPKEIPAKPKNLAEMVRVAEKLSEDFEFVRVDLYDHQGRIYFGELTFSPAGGNFWYFTTESLEFLGKKFDE